MMAALIFREEARERPEIGEPLDVARLRRLEESLALRVEARLKFGGDGEIGGQKSGRVHESPLLAIGRVACASGGLKRATRALARIESSASLCDAPTRAAALTRSGNILHQHLSFPVPMKHHLGGVDRRADSLRRHER